MSNSLVAIYCRVSTDDQAERQTIEAQLVACHKHAEDKGYAVAEDFRDEGVSGAKPLEERDAARRLLRAAEAGLFERVIIYSADRLARDVVEAGLAMRTFKKLGIGVDFVSQSFDDTPEGVVQFQMLSIFAEYERHLIKRRTMDGKIRKAKKREWCSGQLPYGYGYDAETKRLVEDPVEAAVVRRIFDMYGREGLSHRKIAARLNAEGIPTKLGKAGPNSISGETKGWWRGTVSRILTNRLYVGEAFFNKRQSNPNAGRGKGEMYQTMRPREEWIPIDAPALVTEADFLAAEERARQNARWGKLPADRKTDYLLSRLLRCHCGQVMYGRTVRRTHKGKLYENRYYVCAGQHHYRSKCRSNPRVPARWIEEPVWQAIVSAFGDPESVVLACVAHADQLLAEQESQEGRAEEVRSAIEGKDKERDRLVSLCAKGTITEGQLKRQMARIDAEVEELEAELSRIEEATRQKAHVEDVGRVGAQIAEHIEAVADALTIEERKAILRLVVEMIRVAPDNALTVECAVPGVLPETASQNAART